ncbi:MAG: arginine--tRNA ligase [Verrucomicrobiae bacterium]|nr:arginine--tRNA ligase [Verrucomicrobiae bacterium]
MLPHRQLEQRLREAVSAVLPECAPDDLASVVVRPCAEARFGDYQCVALMALAKPRKLNPRRLAEDVLRRLNVSDLCDAAEVAGAGFLNFRLRPATRATALAAAAAAPAGPLFFEPANPPRTIIVDFSSPNVAKAMHVGHIRSTILGDCLARLLRRLGHRVITDNHLGDWGTQFGMLIVGWKRDLNADALRADPLAEMERLYKKINAECEANPATLEAARQELVKLQSGDPENLRIWQEMTALSRAQFDAIYARLGVKFDHTLGESFYNPRLPGVVEALRDRGIARESDGALVVFFEDNPELKDHPAIVRKRDGGFNYTTTDLATVAYRIETWQPDEIIYVTDGRQQLHFKQVFAICRRWLPQTARVRLTHVWFGSILGEDGKPFRTRSGETVKLADLLDEAEERAYRVVSEKNPELSEPERRTVARVVGIGAVKYADLLSNRQSDYVFSWDKMLALSGNTAPYLQYAYARIRSIFRKGNEAPSSAPAPTSLELSAPEEIALGQHLLNFGFALEAAAADARPNFICNYLYELAGRFAQFYENCPVLKAQGAVRASRLTLCDLTARVLAQGLDVLGIEVLERM